MSTRTITFTFRVGGVLTNVTSAVLSSPDGTFGVKRNDTSAVVVADSTAMTHQSTGVYAYTFTEPAAGLAYTAYIKWVYAGATYRQERDLAANVVAASGRYITDTTLASYLGTLNLQIQSEQDPSATATDATNVQRAIDYAEAAVESELVRVFKITDDVGLTWEDEPLLTSESRSLPLIQEVCHQLAGWRLNKWRAVQSLPNDGTLTQSAVDGIASAMEFDAKAALKDWRENPDKLFEVDRTAATSASAIQSAGGIVAKTGDLKCYPATRESQYPYWRNRG